VATALGGQSKKSPVGKVHGPAPSAATNQKLSQFYAQKKKGLEAFRYWPQATGCAEIGHE